MSLDPLYSLLNTANLYRHTNRTDDATIIYNTIITMDDIDPSHKAWACVGLSKIYDRQDNFEKSLSYAQQALHYDHNFPIALYRLADIIMYKSKQRNEGINYYIKILNLDIHSFNFGKVKIKTLIQLGNSRYIDEQHSRTDWYKDALYLLGREGDAKLRAQALIGLGNSRYTDEQHRSQTDWYKDALNLLGKEGDPELRARALIGLGNARYTDEQHRFNADWYKDALNLLGKEGDVTLRAQALIGLGNVRYTDEQHRSDTDWYKDALNLLGKERDPQLRARALIGLGNARYTDEQHRCDADWYKDALNI